MSALIPLGLAAGVAYLVYRTRQVGVTDKAVPPPPPPTGSEIASLPSGAAGSASAQALARYQAAVTTKRPAVVQTALWARYAAALQAEGLPVPPAPPPPPANRIVYCSKAGGCAIVGQPYGTGEVAHALQGEPLGVLEEGQGWLRVRYPAGPVLGRRVHVGWVEMLNINANPPPIGPGQPAPGGSPLTPPPGPLGRREPQDGDACLGQLGCLVIPPHVVDRLETKRINWNSLRASSATIPFGGQVDVLEGPVPVRPVRVGDDIVNTPMNFWDPADPTIVPYYRIRFCYPDGGCVEGWIQRSDLVPAI